MGLRYRPPLKFKLKVSTQTNVGSGPTNFLKKKLSWSELAILVLSVSLLVFSPILMYIIEVSFPISRDVEHGVIIN